MFLLQADSADFARRCPSVDITLQFAHCRCGDAPLCFLEIEEFPRVRRLALYVGKHDPEGYLPYGNSRNMGAVFFRPFISGLSFPDLKDLEVRHYWAAPPPAKARLDWEDQDFNAHAWIHGGETGSIGHPGGLEKLESILFESVPELSSAVLMQLIGNPMVATSNLISLDLRSCQLDDPTVAQLLYHAPPNLKRLNLVSRRIRGGPRDLVRPGRQRDGDKSSMKRGAQDTVHLCPLIREYGKRLERLDYGARRVCRQLFFSDDEILALHENGIDTAISRHVDEGGASKDLDEHAIQQTIKAVRERRTATEREQHIKESLHEMDSAIDLTDRSHSHSAFADTSSARSKSQRDVEALLDEEEAQRHRLINRSTSAKWTRRIILFQELCGQDSRRMYTWDEIKLAADLEERGVHWVLASMSLIHPSKVPTSSDRR